MPSRSPPEARVPDVAAAAHRAIVAAPPRSRLGACSAHAARGADKRDQPLEIVGAGTKRAIGRRRRPTLPVTDRQHARHHALRADRTRDVGAGRHAAGATSRANSLAAARCWRSSRSTSVRCSAAPARRGTIGGVFATNISGARRVTAGAARDHLLGVAAVNGRGEIVQVRRPRDEERHRLRHLPRGLAGSWGTLAVLTEVTFKVLPRPEATATLVLLGLPDEIAIEALCAAHGHAVRGVGRGAPAGARSPRGCGTPACAAHGKSITALRLENFAELRRLPHAARCKEVLKVYGEIARCSTTTSSLDFWGELRQLSVLQAGTAPLWRISTAPKPGPKVVAAITPLHDGRGVLRLVGRPGLARGAGDGRRRRRRHPPRHRDPRRSCHADPRRRRRCAPRSTSSSRSSPAVASDHARHQGRVRSGRHPQSRPHVRRRLTRAARRPRHLRQEPSHADQFHARAARDPRIAEVDAILRRCVHCGLCTATCSTYVLLGDERDSPRGRIYLMKDMFESGRDAEPEVQHHVDRCLSCLSCMTTCPSGVDYMHLVDLARAHIEETGTRTLQGPRRARAAGGASCPIPSGSAWRWRWRRSAARSPA